MKEKVVENKKGEMQEYMQRAAALIHQYVPPNPASNAAQTTLDASAKNIRVVIQNSGHRPATQ